MENCIRFMTERLAVSLLGYEPSVYLYGSLVYGDYRHGWSDIDILVLTNAPIPRSLAETLVCLRQRLCEETGDARYRLFEGAILSREAFFAGATDTVIYWGTSGQRLKDTYALDSFAVSELLRVGQVLLGADERGRLSYPSHADFVRDIDWHYQTIRRYALETSANVRSCGWILDIARGLYTLRTDEVISKTQAGEWALAERIAPEPEILRRVLAIRREPERYSVDAEALAFCASLGSHIQRFADVLETALLGT